MSVVWEKLLVRSVLIDLIMKIVPNMRYYERATETMDVICNSCLF